MSSYKAPSKKMQQAMVQFMAYARPERLGRNLRNMLLSYLLVYEDGHSFDLPDLLHDIGALFDLLDIAADEMEGV